MAAQTRGCTSRLAPGKRGTKEGRTLGDNAGASLRLANDGPSLTSNVRVRWGWRDAARRHELGSGDSGRHTRGPRV